MKIHGWVASLVFLLVCACSSQALSMAAESKRLLNQAQREAAGEEKSLKIQDQARWKEQFADDTIYLLQPLSPEEAPIIRCRNQKCVAQSQ